MGIKLLIVLAVAIITQLLVRPIGDSEVGHHRIVKSEFEYYENSSNEDPAGQREVQNNETSEKEFKLKDPDSGKRKTEETKSEKVKSLITKNKNQLEIIIIQKIVIDLNKWNQRGGVMMKGMTGLKGIHSKSVIYMHESEARVKKTTELTVAHDGYLFKVFAAATYILLVLYTIYTAFPLFEVFQCIINVLEIFGIRIGPFN